MTESDQDRLLSGIVRELSDAKCALGCLLAQADRWADALAQATERLTKLRDGKWFEQSRGTTQLAEFPDHETLTRHVEQILKERDRIEVLRDKLQAMGVNVS